MKNINITISGKIGSGKTTICQIIEKALKKYKFENVSIRGEEENDIEFVEKSYKRRRKYLKDKVNVIITTKNITKQDCK